ncbi:MAG: choline kinase [Planctomycetota bacterium]
MYSHAIHTGQHLVLSAGVGTSFYVKDMKALILAAGRGRRLWPFTAEHPKCLLQVGAISLLERQVCHLRQVGIEQFVVICGFGMERVRTAIDEAGLHDIKLLYNPFYAVSDNLISLWAARSEIDEDFLLLNGDNIFHPECVRSLLQQPYACSLLAKRKERYESDDMKLVLRNKRVERIGKDLPSQVAEAESLGILHFRADGVRALRSALEEVVVEERALSSHFPAVIQHMIDLGHEVSSCFTPGFPCSDVDTPEDLVRVRSELHHYCSHRERFSTAAGKY